MIYLIIKIWSLQLNYVIVQYYQVLLSHTNKLYFHSNYFMIFFFLLYFHIFNVILLYRFLVTRKQSRVNEFGGCIWGLYKRWHLEVSENNKIQSKHISSTIYLSEKRKI